ncbi:MAG: nuclear transport factor 2 family protein [Anaerolineales bacterium]|nr:nuclear transport factor 2 family protein [Anaerolineales bacterium]
MNDALAIQNLIARFASSFDLKDWSALEGCLAPQVFTDYSDLRGTPPETLPAAEYVRLRTEALASLTTHHLLGNLEIDFSAPDQAICRASMLIWRIQSIPKGRTLRDAAGEFNTHCLYTFRLVNEAGTWKIGGITQKILWNNGSPEIHRGAKV